MRLPALPPLVLTAFSLLFCCAWCGTGQLSRNLTLRLDPESNCTCRALSIEEQEVAVRQTLAGSNGNADPEPEVNVRPLIGVMSQVRSAVCPGMIRIASLFC